MLVYEWTDGTWHEAWGEWLRSEQHSQDGRKPFAQGKRNALQARQVWICVAGCNRKGAANVRERTDWVRVK